MDKFNSSVYRVEPTIPLLNEGEFYIDNFCIARQFSGIYTIAEIESILQDMYKVKKHYFPTE